MAKMCLGYKCVWEAKKKSDIGQNYPVPTTCSMLWCNFLWGLRNWLHNKAERGGPYRCGGPCNYTHGGCQWLALHNFEIMFAVLTHAMSECSC